MPELNVAHIVHAFDNLCEKSHVRRYQIPVVIPGIPLNDLALKLGAHGRIDALKIRMSSEKFSFFITNKAGLSDEQVQLFNLFKRVDWDREYGFDSEGMGTINPNEYVFYYMNRDRPQLPYLYLHIYNNGTLPTKNTDFIELTIRQM